MVPRGKYSECRIAMTSRDNNESNWNRQKDERTGRGTGRQDNVSSQADSLTKNPPCPFNYDPIRGGISAFFNYYRLLFLD